ncbi:Autoinducer 2 sensor kinase/phosphatase LuxQ [compost metagenome]
MENSKRFTQTTRGKLVLAFVLVLCVSLLTWIVNRSAFDRINNVVENLTKPNNRLDALNDLQMELGRLNDFYRVEALQNRYKTSDNYDTRIGQISQKLNQLKDSFASDPTQVERLVQVDSIFNQRNKLFDKYLKIRYNYLNNGRVDRQFEELADKIDEENLKIDTNVVTTEKQTKTTTYYSPTPKEEKPAKKRFFRKKKEVEKELKPYVVVEENLKVHVDTLAVAQKKDSILENIRISLDEVELERNTGRRFLQKQELILIKSNEILFNRLLELIDEVKNEERMDTEINSGISIQIARETISFTKILTLIFVLVAFVLIVFIIGDISKFNRYRKQLEASRAEAEFHSQAKQRFLSNMSHEIRSPLQTIVGYSELMLQEEKYDSSKVEVISNASEHLLQVVNEILDYSRIISSNFAIDKKAFDLEEVLAEVVDLSAFQCRHKGIQWKFHSDQLETGFRIVSDPFRLKQILINVLNNAVKFTQEGVVSFEVKMKEHANKLDVDFVVSDTGIGMSSSDLKVVFQQFEQAKNAPVQSGTGLGLSIVKELVEALKGKLQVKSQLDEGTEFTIRFCFEKDKREQESVEKTIETALHVDGVIWVVDDDPVILKLCEHLLAKKQLEFRSFSNPEDLLEAPWDERVKLIFADVRMPGISGIDLCNQLRKRGHKNVKIVALTAQVLPDEKELFLSSGFDGIVLKPFKSQEFYEPIREISEKDMHFDFTALRTLIPDEDDFQEIKNQFTTDSKEDMKTIEEALKTGNQAELLLVVHRLAGRFGQMGAKELAHRLRKLEMKLKAEVFETNEIEAVLPELEKAIDSI